MPPDGPLQFGPYTLTAPQGPLLREAQVVPLPPKALAVLWQLARQAGQVVTKAALLDAVWADTVVSEGVLTRCLYTLRQALGEDAQQPRYIATVHRLGYRFVAPVTPGPIAGPAAAPPAPPRAPAAVPEPPLLLGRAAEVAQLQACFVQAQQGVRQLVVVTGEAGVGKTTLVDAVLHQLEAAAALGLGRGQCIEHYGAGEAYLPLLEALGQLGRGPGGSRLVACLRQYAPTWLAHLPALVPPEALAAGQHQGQGTTRTRMLRELAEALEALAAEQPLVLVLEDLHWSDPSTVEALALLARRREAARLLVVGTYRPVELILNDHPLKRVKQELAAHGQCMEIPLGGLSPQAVAAYVAQRRGGTAGHEAVAAWVYQRTEGHPLFMVQVVDYLAQHSVLQAGTADAPGDLVARELPQGLQDLIAAQVGQLGAEAQQVLEAGSVAGAEFAVASVAAGVQRAPAAVEAVCEQLAQQGQFLDDRGLEEWPDGTVSGRYGWRHALYQEAVYQRLGAGHRARLHRRIGAREAAGYGAHASERAAELAVHFERGQEYPRAVQYLGQAADNAAQRHAPHEVITLLTRGIGLLAHLPATLARVQQELAFQMTLGPAWMITKGQAAPEVEQTYARARALCTQVGDTPQLFPTLWGLYRFYLGRGALATARELAEELAQQATRAADVTARLEAHEARGTTVFYLGDYATARTHFAQAMALPAPTAQQTLVLRRDGGPGVRCLAIGATALWCLGWPGQAVQQSQEALALAQELTHPYSLAVAHYWALALHHHRREAVAVLAHADTLVTLARAQGFALHVGYGTCLRGWARVMQGQRPAGLGQLRQGLAAVLATGLELQRPFGLVLLAEAVGAGGQVTEGLRLLAEARTVLEATGQGDLLAEVYRLQGAFLLCQAVPDVPQAEACFHQGLTIARRQQAKSWELRTAMSLSRLWQGQGKRAAAYELLAPIYGWFTEGFDTADLQEARALLKELER